MKFLLAHYSSGRSRRIWVYVFMHINPQQVTCFPNPGAAFTEKGCLNTLSLLPLSATMQSFGPRGNSAVEVDVPRTWKENDSPRSGCAVVLYTKDNVIVRSNWSGLWLRASAVNAMCVRRGLTGQYRLRDVNDTSKEMVIGLMSAWPPPMDAL